MAYGDHGETNFSEELRVRFFRYIKDMQIVAFYSKIRPLTFVPTPQSDIFIGHNETYFLRQVLNDSELERVYHKIQDNPPAFAGYVGGGLENLARILDKDIEVNNVIIRYK